MNLKIFYSIFLISIVSFSLSISISAQDKISVDFDSDQWVKVNAEVTEYMGRKSMAGIASLKDVEFENGIIEVDIATTHDRSYPGILFRIQNMQDYERFYIRPHRSKFYTDVLQYVAAFNGIDSWQLYNGEGATAGAIVPPDQWNHLKIEVAGETAKIYWIDMDTPALVIDKLSHGISKGTLGINGPKDGTAYFSNFSYQIDNTIDLGEQEPVEKSYGIIKDWEISQNFPLTEVDFEKTPDELELTNIKWQKVESDYKGLVDLSLFTSRQNRAGDCLFAKTNLKSDTEKLLNLTFGYSDYITIFFDGKPVYFGNKAYRSQDPSFLGIVGYNDNIFLPLKKGNNELMILVGETFGGWAFMFKDADAVYMDESLTKVWESKRKVQIPESVIYDRKRDLLYVTSYFNGGKEYISKMKTTGEIEKLEWVTGLSMPTGMIIFNDKLYSVDRKSLYEIDIEKGEILNKFPIPNAKFPNDIIADEDGNFYITDTQANTLYKFANGSFEVWLQSDEIPRPNGLFINDGNLLVGLSDEGCIKSIDLSTKEIEQFVCVGKGANMDGIKQTEAGEFIISDYNGRIFLLSKTGEIKELLNRKTPQEFCADFEYIKEKNMLIVPSLFNNEIAAYKLK